MYNFIDLHSHALFGVDDGANSKEMSFNMLDLAYSDGIKTICFTPHFKMHHFSDDSEINTYNERILNNYNTLCEYAKDKYPDMRLLIGNEIMFHNDICNSLASQKCKFVGDSKYVLIEFRPETPFFEMKNIISKISRRGFFPIVAHIERYATLIKNFQQVSELRELGALMQVNSQSITRFKFGRTACFIRKALKMSFVDIVCTDAHDDVQITPTLSKSYNLVRKVVGKEHADLIYFINPNKIVNNIRIL